MPTRDVPLTQAQSAAHPLLRNSLPLQVGPPTAPLNLAHFARDAQGALSRAEAALAQLSAQLDASPFGKQAKERCSVTDLSKDLNALYDSPECHLALEAWRASRTVPTRSATFAGDPSPEEAHAQRSSSVAAAAGVGASSSSIQIGGTRKVEEAIRGLLEGADRSPLGMVRDGPEAYSAFIHKSRRHELNTLTTQLTTPIPAQPAPATPSTTHPHPLSDLALTVTFHSIPRKPTKRTPTFALPTQTLLLRGSTTLAELRHALKLACEGVPAEVEDEQVEDVMDDDSGSDATDPEEEGGSESEDDMEAAEKERARRTRWKSKQRVTGCVFGVEDVLYGDDGGTGTDYAKMILEQINTTDWAARPRKKRPRERSSSPEDEPVAQPQPPSDDDADDAHGPANRPVYSIGRSTSQARIGEMAKLRAGEPYWFMHQGNCEHIWEVHSVRHVHPNDTPLADPSSLTSTAPYPITSFLSRVPQAQCRICERDPGEIVTLDDQLAGEGVGLLCVACFGLLHGGWGEGGVESGRARDGIRAVPTLVAE